MHQPDNVAPSWHFASTIDGDRYAVITDLDHDYTEDVPCAQLQVMKDDVFMVRRSSKELGHLLLADYSTTTVTLDKWYLQEHFDDCTDGYMFTKDRRLAAETCVTWFRDKQDPGAKIDIGCDYRYADQLLPEDQTLF